MDIVATVAAVIAAVSATLQVVLQIAETRKGNGRHRR